MSQGARNWPFLMFTGRPLPGNVLNEIGLSAQKGRCLQHIDNRSHLIQGRIFVHIGQHRHADLLLDLFQDRQSFLDPGAAVAAVRRAVRLVEGRFVDKGNTQGLR